jgi:tRNA (cytidine32/uridine32-2'-O)-methyltransferase
MDLKVLERFFVVLVAPKHPGNVGAVARAMGNMGLSELRIVDARGAGGLGLENHPDALARACDSTDVLERTRTFPDLPSALSGSVYAVGTSARKREGPTPEAPREVAADISARAREGPVALVFGREDDGLTVEEVARCHALIKIPTAPGRSSLNLSHAVQLVTYEVMLAAANPAAASRPAPAPQETRDALFTHAERALKAIGAFPPELFERKLRYFRQVIDRAQPATEEIHFLHGMFRQMEWVVSRWTRGLPPPPTFTGSAGGLPEEPIDEPTPE